MSEVNDIIERINAAIVRIAQGHAPMRIPADAHSDADIVLGDAATEIARLRAELEEAQRERKALLDAARNWWEGYRPLRWSEEEHIAQPRVNLMTTRDGELATLVAAIAAQGDAHG